MLMVDLPTSHFPRHWILRPNLSFLPNALLICKSSKEGHIKKTLCQGCCERRDRHTNSCLHFPCFKNEMKPQVGYMQVGPWALIVSHGPPHMLTECSGRRMWRWASGLRRGEWNFKIIDALVLNYVCSQGSSELWFSLFCQRKKEIYQEAGPVHRKSHLGW